MEVYHTNLILASVLHNMLRSMIYFITLCVDFKKLFPVGTGEEKQHDS